MDYVPIYPRNNEGHVCAKKRGRVRQQRKRRGKFNLRAEIKSYLGGCQIDPRGDFWHFSCDKCRCEYYSTLEESSAPQEYLPTMVTVQLPCSRSSRQVTTYQLALQENLLSKPPSNVGKQIKVKETCKRRNG